MRIALGVEYAGHHFHGWQAQKDLTTVQQSLERALSKVADEPIQVICAGRTDTGVHASGQVVHFDTNVVRRLDAWVLGTNSYLEKSISVHWVKMVPDDFHARYSAVLRRYRYLIHNHSIRPTILEGRVTWHYRPLKIDLMQQGAKYLLGEHDFSSFRAAECQAKTAIRNVQEISITRQQHIVTIDVQANAFLHHMVRNIAGVLMMIGGGFEEPDWADEVLNARDRRAAGATAPPDGLYLTRVVYPEIFQIPEPVATPIFLLNGSYY